MNTSPFFQTPVNLMSNSFQRTKTDEQIYREAFIRSDASDAQRWFSILPRWHRFAAEWGHMEHVKDYENYNKWMSTLIILSGITCFAILVYSIQWFSEPESSLGLHAHFSLAICMVLSLFYRSSHSKGVKILIFILQLPWIFIFVDTVSLYLWTAK